MGRNSGVSRQTTSVSPGCRLVRQRLSPGRSSLAPDSLSVKVEFLGDSLLSEGVELQAEILVVRADAGVTERAPLIHLLCPNIRVE